MAAVPTRTRAASAASAPGLRERKRLRTEADLRRAALELFAEHGYDRVTIDEIAEAADVSKRTFYRYFEGKEDVLFTDESESIEHLRAAFAAPIGRERLFTTARRAILEVAAEYEEQRDDLAAHKRVVSSTPALVARSLERQERWAAALTSILAERLGADADDLVPKLFAADLIATFRVTFDHWLAHPDAPSLVDLLGVALDVLEHGLGRR